MQKHLKKLTSKQCKFENLLHTLDHSTFFILHMAPQCQQLKIQCHLYFPPLSLTHTHMQPRLPLNTNSHILFMSDFGSVGPTHYHSQPHEHRSYKCTHIHTHTVYTTQMLRAQTSMKHFQCIIYQVFYWTQQIVYMIFNRWEKNAARWGWSEHQTLTGQPMIISKL